jgi:cell division protein ZapA (FtsZ GTPase activity inhibitor)
MSGPKVVVLVTREQMLAMADGLLKRLDQAIASWAAEGQRCGMLSDEEIAATRRRRASLAALMETDDLVQLQKRVPDEIAYLKADVAKRQQAAADKAEQAARRKRHARHGAATVLRALEAKGIAVSSELGESLARMRAGQMLDNADTVLARAFTLLAPAAPAVLSAAQEALAQGLRSSADTAMDVQAWKAANAALDRDPVIARLRSSPPGSWRWSRRPMRRADGS